MKTYRVYFRTTLSSYGATHAKSTTVSAENKQDAIQRVVSDRAKYGLMTIPTGYVTLVGKPHKPF